MDIDVHRSVFSYQHKAFPQLRFVTDNKVIKIFCDILKIRYEGLPSRITVVICDPPRDEFFPESLNERLREEGYDVPIIDEGELRSEREEEHCIEVDMVNMEKMDILNQAAALGCSWATEEIKRLFVTEAH